MQLTIIQIIKVKCPLEVFFILSRLAHPDYLGKPALVVSCKFWTSRQRSLPLYCLVLQRTMKVGYYAIFQNNSTNILILTT